AAADVVDVAGRLIVPGFVDVHCHGGAGAEFAEFARIDRQRAVLDAIAWHRAHGSTTLLASLVSRSIAELVNQVAALAELVESGELAGIHLEGPFISPARCGAHDPSALRVPDADSIAALLRAGRGAVRMVTLAPELPGAVDAVRQFVDAGVIVAIGHTDATEQQVRPAVDAGATVATHLFNGMRPLHHREPGPVGALLDDERVSVELICDLVHLAPTIVRLVARHAGPARTVLVTDAMAASGMPDGEYDLGALRVTVRDGEPRLADGSLAGSTLTMDAALRNAVTAGLSITDAVTAAATRPASLLGGVSGGVLGDVLRGESSANAGVLAVGKSADLLVLSHDLRLERVMRHGDWLAN
ncbi:MAG: N-acetylglucosamine-6-phosphate deacetylase, partial [Sciscionella sp.]|nr:N-acetylglucosamine-6-phosphate deacetylase [Sciscionella sp.]